jgi:hypothetical protein
VRFALRSEAEEGAFRRRRRSRGSEPARRSNLNRHGLNCTFGAAKLIFDSSVS